MTTSTDNINMKRHINNTFLAAAGCILVPMSASAAVTLVEVDFSGSGGVGTIGSADSEFTVKDAAVTFDDTATTLNAIGGSVSTGGWNYDGTGAAAANNDLHIGSTFGGPTRFDLDLGVAASGQSFTITSVELDIRASNQAGTTWEFGYRKSSDSTTVLIGSQTIPTQSGADPIATYSIDLTGENLTATDSTTAWDTGGSGELRWLFYEPTGTNADNFQVDAIRIIGTVAVPEPSSSVLLVGGLLGLVVMRRRTS